MPGHGFGILAQLGIIEFTDRPAPKIVVVIENPDCGPRVLLAKQRSQVFRNKFDLVFLRPKAGWHPAILVGVDFVLRRDGLNRHSCGRIGVEEL